MCCIGAGWRTAIPRTPAARRRRPGGATHTPFVLSQINPDAVQSLHMAPPTPHVWSAEPPGAVVAARRDATSTAVGGRAHGRARLSASSEAGAHLARLRGRSSRPPGPGVLRTRPSTRRCDPLTATFASSWVIASSPAIDVVGLRARCPPRVAVPVEQERARADRQRAQEGASLRQISAHTLILAHRGAKGRARARLDRQRLAMSWSSSRTLASDSASSSPRTRSRSQCCRRRSARAAATRVSGR